MHPEDNLFRSPQSSPRLREEDEETRRRPFVSIESLGTLAGVFGFFGAIAGLVGGIAATILADRYSSVLLPASVGPSIPQGAQWIVYTLPACMLLGIVMGCGIAAGCAGRAWQGLAAVVTLSLLAAGFNQWLWWSQIARFGRTEAEISIYYPPLMLSIAAWVLSLWLARQAFLSRHTAERGDQPRMARNTRKWV